MNDQARYGTHPDRLQARQHNSDRLIITKTEYGKISVGKEWVSLTDKEIEDLWGEPVNCMYSVHYNAIRAIEAKLKEKNT
jgi:hypothetical protein